MNIDALRIIDANLNRASEALRVLEEYARFVLQDSALSKQAKVMRHALAEVAQRFENESLLLARNTQADVGTQISTEAEGLRSHPAAVARAAAKRLTESLRCIEEYSKICCADAAARIEQLRYEAYTLEQDIFTGGSRRARLRRARLHVLVTESMCQHPWQEVCELALAGGVDVLQLREKTLSDRELLNRARWLRKLTCRHDALLIINDRPDIARLAGADGVHLGQEDLSVSSARQIVGPNVLIGKSTHSISEAEAALREAPDYVAVGPLFATPTKPGVEVRGTSLLKDVLSMAACELAERVPVVAIGGITAENVVDLVRVAGEGSCLQVAVCQGVLTAMDPAGAATAIKKQLISQ